MFNNTIFGIIYLIKHKTCDDTKKVYVGSTNNLKKRINIHRHDCNNEKSEKYNLKLYQYLRENGGFYMYEFIILESYVCNFKHELHYKEDDYIQMYPNNLNSQRAYLTDEEYKKKNNEKSKKYRDENKDIINERKKKYYDENKDIIKKKLKKYYDENKDKIKKYREDNKEQKNEYSKKYYDENKEYFKKYYDENKEKINEKIICECGSIVRKDCIPRHCKSLKHIQYIEKK